MIQKFLRDIYPSLLGFLTKLIYQRKNVSFKGNFKCDSIPKILIDNDSNLRIGKDVIFRRNVEIRVHNKAEIFIHNNVKIDRGVRLLSTNNSHIVLGEGVRIGLYSVFNGGDSIEIGSSTLISGFVYVQTSMHGHKDKTSLIQKQGYFHSPIKIKNDCWLGAHSVVMPGVILGRGVVVGSNAVVNKSFDSNLIIAGVPAKVLKERE